MRRIVGLVAILAVSWQSAAQAQVGIELIPHAGYRWSTGLDTAQGFRDIDAKDGAAYGIGISFPVRYDASAEITWTHWSGDLEAITTGGASFVRQFSVDDILLSGVYYLTRVRNAATRPYITLGLGCAIFDSETADAVGRFAWSLGAGVRHDVNERFGLRAEFKWLPVWVTTGTGVWCDPFFCYTLPSGETFDQFEVTGGVIVKLGRR